MLQIICCGYEPCSEFFDRCRESIAMQRHTDYQVTVMISAECPRTYLVENTVLAIEMANPAPNDILVFVDLDDYLCDDDCFGIVAEEYASDRNLLLTYGSYVNLSTSERGKFQGPYGTDEVVRTAPWRASHLKTMKASLWQHIPNKCFRDRGGEYLQCCADRAMMIPAMEIAGPNRCKYLEQVMYVYNDLNPMSVWSTMKRTSQRTRDFLSFMAEPMERADI